MTSVRLHEYSWPQLEFLNIKVQSRVHEYEPDNPRDPSVGDTSDLARRCCGRTTTGFLSLQRLPHSGSTPVEIKRKGNPQKLLNSTKALFVRNVECYNLFFNNYSFRRECRSVNTLKAASGTWCTFIISIWLGFHLFLTVEMSFNHYEQV